MPSGACNRRRPPESPTGPPPADLPRPHPEQRLNHRRQTLRRPPRPSGGGSVFQRSSLRLLVCSVPWSVDSLVRPLGPEPPAPTEATRAGAGVGVGARGHHAEGRRKPARELRPARGPGAARVRGPRGRVPFRGARRRTTTRRCAIPSVNADSVCCSSAVLDHFLFEASAGRIK